MGQFKKTLVASLALFSLFFGAGNLILPPLLGFKSGDLWWLVTIGFGITAVLVPILGILAHARIQGTMFDFARKVSPNFSLAYCLIIYAVSISLPSPRTASVTHEMAIAPFFQSSAWITSIVYFALVFVFAMNRSRILDIIGKWLTPAILLILFAIIGITLFSADFTIAEPTMTGVFASGLIEGYQTFDAIGAVVVGGVIIISINLNDPEASFEEKRKLIGRAGIIAGSGLLLVYSGLILTGAQMQGSFDAGIARTALLNGIGKATLGNTTNIFLSMLIALACFTTAVGIVTGTSDYIGSRLKNQKRGYLITAVVACILGVFMGQFDVGYIIRVALPALMLVYPITIALIILNVLPERLASEQVFRLVIICTIIFSIPDFLNSLGFPDLKVWADQWLPLGEQHMGWLIPGVITWVFGILFRSKQREVS